MFSWLKTNVPLVEAQVVQIIANIKADIEVAEADLIAGVKWLQTNAPQIVADLQLAVGFATAIGGAAVSPAVLIAANEAVAALNAVVAAGTPTDAASAAAVLVNGYKAITTADLAVAQVKADAATAAATAVAPAA